MSPERDFAHVLDEALALCRAGRSLEEVLARFPEDADRLAPLLETVHRIAAVPRVSPPPNAESASKARMMRVLEEKKKSGAAHQQNILDILGNGLKGQRGKRLILILASLAVLFIIISSISVLAIHALPGSWFYPAKTGFMETRIMLTLDPHLKAERITQYHRLLLDDLAKAVDLGRLTEAEAQATLTAMPTPFP
jgi:hypothetical protein